METLILGWYILVETQSVLLLTLFASLQHLGTLVAPLFGVLGDRLGPARVLCAMRLIYATLAGALMTFAYLDLLTPVHVFAIAAMVGLVRPSDLAMRAALIGERLPPALLMGAMSFSRITQDSARIAGALTGAGVVAMLGMGPAYTMVVGLYGLSVVLTLSVVRLRGAHVRSPGASHEGGTPWRELREGIAYVRASPQLVSVMYLAVLINLTAFPLVNGLLPYVAKEVYHVDRTGLGYMVASLASGALLGSILLSRRAAGVRAARTMLATCVVWYGLLLWFAQVDNLLTGMLALAAVGVAQSLSQVPMQTLLLRNSEARFRGRVMGLRQLAIYGLPVGLLVSGPLIARFGWQAAATAYCLAGLALTLAIAVGWRSHLWRRDAAANAR